MVQINDYRNDPEARKKREIQRQVDLAIGYARFERWNKIVRGGKNPGDLTNYLQEHNLIPNIGDCTASNFRFDFEIPFLI